MKMFGITGTGFYLCPYFTLRFTLTVRKISRREIVDQIIPENRECFEFCNYIPEPIAEAYEEFLEFKPVFHFDFYPHTPSSYVLHDIRNIRICTQKVIQLHFPF